MASDNISRRSFLAFSASAITGAASGAQRTIPIGLELYSVRNALAKDLPGTVQAVGKMGYQVVEFFSPYFDWTADYARQVRKIMDDAGVRCNSTHNGPPSFTADGLKKAQELNQILGAKFIVMASAGRIAGLDGWKRLAETLSEASDTLRPAGMRAGYHNHQLEFTPLEGKRPMEVIAAGTPKDFMLQLDVGTCVEVGSDPVKWIEANPGRINSLHLKDWKKGEGYRVLFGEGEVPWKAVLAAAEKVGGVEYYLIEQEGSRFGELETAEKCLQNFKRIHRS